jgi:hypothetical protein
MPTDKRGPMGAVRKTWVGEYGRLRVEVVTTVTMPRKCGTPRARSTAPREASIPLDPSPRGLLGKGEHPQKRVVVWRSSVSDSLSA